MCVSSIYLIPTSYGVTQDQGLSEEVWWAILLIWASQ